MAAISTRFGPIGVDVAGDCDTPLLFLHGVGSDRRAWAGQLARFGPTRQAIAIDMPGYGDSIFIEGATRRTYAEVALAVLDALGIARAHVCGLSLGGVVALTLFDLAPERCASLILADSFARHPDGPAILARSIGAARTLGMRGLAESRVSALLADSADLTLHAAVVETMAGIDPAAYAIAAEAVWLADQRDIAARVNCPALVLCGSEDRITPPFLSEELKQLIPGAGLVEILGAGHLSNLEHPAIFDRVLLSFLGQFEMKP